MTLSVSIVFVDRADMPSCPLLSSPGGEGGPMAIRKCFNELEFENMTSTCQGSFLSDRMEIVLSEGGVRVLYEYRPLQDAAASRRLDYDKFCEPCCSLSSDVGLWIK